MRVKTSLAVVELIEEVDRSSEVRIAIGLLVGVVATRATTPTPERIPNCLCIPETISVGGHQHGA